MQSNKISALELAWPNANFYYHPDGLDFNGVIDDYINGKCEVLAIGYETTSLDSYFLERLCDENLVFTTSVIIEVPVALPCREDLSSGLSYWIREGGDNGITLQKIKEKYKPSLSCNVHFNGDEIEVVSLSHWLLYSDQRQTHR